MDSKGEESKMSYPNIFFMIDSFEEVSAHRAGHVPLPLLLGIRWDARLRTCKASQEMLVAGAGDGQGDSQWGSPLHSD